MSELGPRLLIRTRREWAPHLHYRGFGILVENDDPAVAESWRGRGFAVAETAAAAGPAGPPRAADFIAHYIEVARRGSRAQALGRGAPALAGPDLDQGAEAWEARLLAAFLVPEAAALEIARYPENWSDERADRRRQTRLLQAAYTLAGLPAAAARDGGPAPETGRPAEEGPVQVALLEEAGQAGSLDPAARLLLRQGIRPVYLWRAGELNERRPAFQAAVIDLSWGPGPAAFEELGAYLDGGGHLVAFGARDGSSPLPLERLPAVRVTAVEWPLRPEIDPDLVRRVFDGTPLAEPLARPRPLATERYGMTGLWLPRQASGWCARGLQVDLLAREFQPAENACFQPGQGALLRPLAGEPGPDEPPPMVSAACHATLEELPGRRWRILAEGPLGSRGRVRLRVPRTPASVSPRPASGRGFYYIWDANWGGLTLTFANAPEPLEIVIQAGR